MTRHWSGAPPAKMTRPLRRMSHARHDICTVCDTRICRLNRGFEGGNAGMGFMSRLPAATGLLVLGLSASSAGAQSMTAVTQLGWLRIGEYAPIKVAEAKGFFKDEGIDHKTVDGGPGKNPIPIVAVGQAQFGLATNGMMIVTARLAKDP